MPSVIFKSMCLSFYCFFSSTHFSILRKLRWHSFQNSHRPSVTSASLEINSQSAAQLNLLQKFSLLRLTAILEKHTDHHQTRLELVRKHILIHTNSYTVTHFLNNPQDFSSRLCTLLKNECDCVHIDVVDTFSDSWDLLWHLCSYVWGKKSNFWQKCFLMAQSVE